MIRTQLSERLASLGIRKTQKRTRPKSLGHHITIVSSGIGGEGPQSGTTLRMKQYISVTNLNNLEGVENGNHYGRLNIS